jgi:hypothetical protein
MTAGPFSVSAPRNPIDVCADAFGRHADHGRGSCLRHACEHHQIDLVPNFWSQFCRAAMLLVDSLKRPTTVAWFIIAKRIDAVEFVTFWAYAHVDKEVWKVFPSFANRNA